MPFFFGVGRRFCVAVAPKLSVGILFMSAFRYCLPGAYL